jgi:hypothetical protein
VIRHFMKPFNPVELMSAISNLVRNGELDKDLSFATS